MPEQKVNLIISGRYVVTMNREQDVIEGGAVALGGDSIIAVGEALELHRMFPEAERITEPDGLIMPGLVNTHTHVAMACFRGLSDDLPLMEWLQDHIFPAEAKLDQKMVYQATLLSLCEMIKSGTTSFNDMYLFSKAVAQAVETSGMRAWLGEVFYDFPSPSYGDLENGFTYVQELLDGYGDHPLINITINPHAVYTCSPGLITRLAELARKNDATCHIHLSETAGEVSDCMQAYGSSPVMHLEKLGVLGPNLVAAHCVKITDEEIALLVKRGVKVAHCAESNLKLASGIAPVVKMLDAGLVVGIGTDGAASNNDVDMFGEMSSVAKIHKVNQMNPRVMDARTTLHAATLGGATVLGADNNIGTLEPGKKADCIVLDLNQPHLTPIYHPTSHLVYAARGSDVIHSVINGRLVMRSRQLLTLDEAAIISAIKEIQAQISTAG